MNKEKGPNWADIFFSADSGIDGANFALNLTDMIAENNPDAKFDPNCRIARFLAFKTKGIQVLREVGFLEVDVAEQEELEQYITNEHLDFLECALQEYSALQALDEKEVTEKLSSQVDVVALIVEKCRPGRVHAILGWTKLWYFGLARLGIMDHVKRGLPVEQRRPFLKMPFSFPLPFKSALAFDYGHDALRGLYLSFMLLHDFFSDWGPDDKIGDHSVGIVTLYKDGSYKANRDVL